MLPWKKLEEYKTTLKFGMIIFNIFLGKKKERKKKEKNSILRNYVEDQNVFSIFSFKKVLQKVEVIMLMYIPATFVPTMTAQIFSWKNSSRKKKEISYPMGKKDLLLVWQCIMCPAFVPQLTNILQRLPLIGVGRQQENRKARMLLQRELYSSSCSRARH